jgi:hypothetical protein
LRTKNPYHQINETGWIAHKTKDKRKALLKLYKHSVQVGQPLAAALFPHMSCNAIDADNGKAVTPLPSLPCTCLYVPGLASWVFQATDLIGFFE